MPSRPLRNLLRRRNLRPLLALASLAVLAAACAVDRAPAGLRRTPSGPGAVVRFDLAHKPLPDIPMPSDTATWPDPTSRTGLRINASVVAPTSMETQARLRFTEMEGWGTFAPITVAFDIEAGANAPALDRKNIRQRHVGDDYDFADDAVYVINLTTGAPAVLDLGAGNFSYVLRSLDRYWPNDTRRSERNLLFETIDETKGGSITPELFSTADDTDFDGTLDIPNLFDPEACPGPDPVCDNPADPGAAEPDCIEARRVRDRCIADNLLTFYERETDTLILRPLLPLDEMTRYAVVISDRTLDGLGRPVKSPFELIYHASMESTAQRVMEVLNDPALAEYYGDLHGTGLDRVAYTWSFTTQPTVDDMRRLRDGLYGAGPFARFKDQFPPAVELTRSVGLTAGLSQGATEDQGWATTQEANDAGCPADAAKANLFVVKYQDVKEELRTLVVDGFGLGDGPGSELLLKTFENIDHMVLGSFKAPYLLEGGPASADPNAAFRLNFLTGEGEVHADTVPFWLVVPKETSAHKQPFDVTIYGHGYTGNFSEALLYAGNMAQHGLATVGINAMGHGLHFSEGETALATGILRAACIAPFVDAVTSSRARDLDGDERPDSGGDFWSSYLFHTRDGVRQSVLDHIQLVRILRSFGEGGAMVCRGPETGWDQPASEACDLNGDGAPEAAGDFDADGAPDVGGVSATYGTWGESLGGILSAIHGAVDPYVTTAVPGSGGGGLSDIALRSFQGGVVEAVLLRMLGPLVVSIPAAERPSCADSDSDKCSVCAADETSLRWVVPDVNGTGEVEIGCFAKGELKDTTVFVENVTNGEVRCAALAGDAERMRVGVPASVGDWIQISFVEGTDIVTSFGTCSLKNAAGVIPTISVGAWGKGRFSEGTENEAGTATCQSPTCTAFQGYFLGEGEQLVAPAEGLGEIRQTPGLRRFLTLAQAALDPGDPVSFAPYYSIKKMTDPAGKEIAPHAVLTLNTIGDMNVPVNTGIAFARATGALPFFRPDQAVRFPHYADYATPAPLYEALGGRTPNQQLIENHVIEGITELARHGAGLFCENSSNALAGDATFTTASGESKACFPECPANACYSGSSCNTDTGKCEPNRLGAEVCEEALFDADDVDEGSDRYWEQRLPVPHRLARYTLSATPETLADVWGPRILGAPMSPDGGFQPDPSRPLTALLDAYVVPQGTHTFVNGEPCQAFDHGTYLTNLTARFFMTNGADLYYLSHPSSHRCLGRDVAECGYLAPK